VQCCGIHVVAAFKNRTIGVNGTPVTNFYPGTPTPTALRLPAEVSLGMPEAMKTMAHTFGSPFPGRRSFRLQNQIAQASGA
jgi:hypothetical protein